MAYHSRLTSADGKERVEAAQAWDRWTTKIVTWTIAKSAQDQSSSAEKQEKDHQEDDTEKLVRSIRLETHYAINRYFLQQEQLINNIKQLPDVPVTIIHGRRDITCPLESSWRIHQAIPDSVLTILPESGHLANETAMIDALVTATDAMSINNSLKSFHR